MISLWIIWLPSLPGRSTPFHHPILCPRLADPETRIATVAGACRYSGDGQAAADASLNCPQGIAVDGSGDLFIADTYNNVVREVNSSTGMITTVAGNGICGYSGDGGPATAAELDDPAASRWTPPGTSSSPTATTT